MYKSNNCFYAFGVCDILNNQGLSKCYPPRPSASADNTYLDLNYSGYHKNLIQHLLIIMRYNTFYSLVSINIFGALS